MSIGKVINSCTFPGNPTSTVTVAKQKEFKNSQQKLGDDELVTILGISCTKFRPECCSDVSPAAQIHMIVHIYAHTGCRSLCDTGTVLGRQLKLHGTHQLKMTEGSTAENKLLPLGRSAGTDC